MWKSWRVVAALVATLVVGGVLGFTLGRSGGIPTAAPTPAQPSDPSRLVYRVPVDDSPVKGPADALVTVVEVSDFQCPFCKRALPTLKQIESTYGSKVRFVFKHNPLSFHDKAMAAAVAAEQARAQGGDTKFWEMHDQLFAISPELDRTMLVPAAERIGLDAAAFKAGLDSGKFDARIRRDQQLVTSLGAGATPTFFINGRKVEGALPFEQFKKIIDEELARAEERVKAGTPPKQLYAALIDQGLTQAPPQPPSAARPAAPPLASRVPVRADDPLRGPKVAKVTLVLFSDFQCPFCARLEPTLKQLTEAYPRDVRIVWKHQPLTMHPQAMPAAEAAEAAREQGKFWEMHDKMFAAQQQLSVGQYESWARELGLNLGKFKSSLDEHRHRSRIDEDAKLASAVGATGTPTLFLNCRQVVGAKPFEELRGIVDQEIQKAADLINGGSKLDGAFYDQICDRNVKSLVAQAPPAPTVEVPLRADDPIRGNTRAPVTLVVFSDFQCPFCSRAEGTLAEVRKVYADKVRIAWKHQPLSIHPNAVPAALAAEAAREQGKFWEMHDKMFANQAALSPEAYDRWAAELGLDLDRFRRSQKEQRLAQRVADDSSLGSRIGAGGTPTFFINGERVVGAVSFEQLKVVIDRQLSRSARR